jgi:hypothetical protein
VSTIEGSAWTNTQLDKRAADTRHIAWNLPIVGACMNKLIKFMEVRQEANGSELGKVACRFGHPPRAVRCRRAKVPVVFMVVPEAAMGEDQPPFPRPPVRPPALATAFTPKAIS